MSDPNTQSDPVSCRAEGAGRSVTISSPTSDLGILEPVVATRNGFGPVYSIMARRRYDVGVSAYFALYARLNEEMLL